jgi:hypothetical protein
VAAHEASLKVAEKKALAQLQKVRAVPMAQVQRKQHWFERFNWFISRYVCVYRCVYRCVCVCVCACVLMCVSVYARMPMCHM